MCILEFRKYGIYLNRVYASGKGDAVFSLYAAASIL